MAYRLMALMFFVVATTLMGIFVTAVLSMGAGTGRAIAVASAAGFILAIPVSWMVSRNMTRKLSR